MKKWVSKIVTMCLAFAMVVTMLTPVNVQAATKTKSMTLYKGEAIYYTDYSDVKSVKSSKKSVVSVAKDSSYSSHANITAKKTGKATVTIKTKSGTMKYNITVKKLDVTAKLTDMGNGNLLVTVKNNTKQTFEDIILTYTLRDETGEVKEKNTVTVYDVVAGKTVYTSISYSPYAFTPDLSQCTVTATSVDRNPSYKYTNASSKVTTTVTQEDSDSANTMKFSVKTKNTLKDKRVYGYVYIRIYDEDGNLVDLEKLSVSLKGGAIDTVSRSAYLPYGTDSTNYTYKVSTVAYYYTY